MDGLIDLRCTFSLCRTAEEERLHKQRQQEDGDDAGGHDGKAVFPCERIVGLGIPTGKSFFMGSCHRVPGGCASQSVTPLSLRSRMVTQ